MSLRSVTFATPPVLTQDSQGPQTAGLLKPRSADQILCIRQVTRTRLRLAPNKLREDKSVQCMESVDVIGVGERRILQQPTQALALHSRLDGDKLPGMRHGQRPQEQAVH